ncbi:uncharacterized protein LOC124845034 [Vigna umbellata]|uniref:uncharacterized protein LOC124845034 n=1 Tax=Vigna umbellata TaxID=87088 RepID=UPI001F5FDEF0|nr:uncharacterized protein LOC124845034 [Vigna umbellata]
MAFRTGNDAIWCQAFSLSPEGVALEWFNSLPPNSIKNFGGLQRMFNRQFASSSTQDLTIFELVNLRQGKEETLKTFMDRYQKIVRRVKGLSPELTLQYVLLALKLGLFKDSEGQEIKGDKTDGKKLDGQPRKPGGFKQREQPRGPRFQQYTPLNAPRARLLQEALNADLIREPKGRPMPPRTEDNKHYSYYKNMGHTTEECVTLKDKIEELIQAGQLKKYVKVDRPGEPLQQPRSPRRASPQRPERCERSRHTNHYRSERRRSQSRSRSHDRPLRGHINTISGGFAGGFSSSSARKRHVRALRSVHAVDMPRRTMLPITFLGKDFLVPDPD